MNMIRIFVGYLNILKILIICFIIKVLNNTLIIIVLKWCNCYIVNNKITYHILKSLLTNI